MAKKTVKELNKDVEIILEKFEMLKSDHEERINILKGEFEERIKTLENKLEIFEDLKLPSKTESVGKMKCRECGLSLAKLSDLKTHIIALHPKQYTCNVCAEIFDSSVTYELHLRTHALKKNYKCETCGQMFYMKWRLQKHMKQHDMTNVKYCHFYNNNKFCRFEELGCMFRHEDAPLCNRASLCRSKMCQFKHEFIQENPNIIESFDMETHSDYQCDKCSFVSKTVANIEFHRSSKHEVPNDINNLNNIEHIDDSGDAEEKDDSEHSDFEESDDDVNVPNNYNDTTRVYRCDYGLCDFQQVLFKTNEDLKVHLVIIHGIGESC